MLILIYELDTRRGVTPQTITILTFTIGGILQTDIGEVNVKK